MWHKHWMQLSLVQTLALLLALLTLGTRCSQSLYLADLDGSYSELPAPTMKDGPMLATPAVQEARDQHLSRNLRRYLLADLDLNGHTMRPNVGRWRVMRIDQLLETLSSGLAAPVPIYGRQSRGKFPKVRIIQETTTKSPEARMAPKEEEESSAMQTHTVPVYGIEWNPLTSGFWSEEAQSMATTQKPISMDLLQAEAKQQQKQQQQQQQIDTDGDGLPVILTHAPSRPSTKLEEWKRAENTRWNVLRGMWG